MPSQILHVLHGKAVLALVPSGKAILADQELEGLFCLGCQGPDIFYHNQRTRPLALEYGSLLHRRGYGSFAAALGASLAATGARGQAHLAGFICHAFLDRALHPFLISRAGPGPGSSSLAESSDLAGATAPARSGVEADGNSRARLHIFLERLLDVALAGYLKEGQNLRAQTELLTLPARTALGWLPAPLAAALRTAFPARASHDEKLEQRIKNALSDSAGFFEATDPENFSDSPLVRHLLPAEASPGNLDRRLSLAALIHPRAAAVLNQMEALDVLNLGHAEWLHPCEGCAAGSDSVPDLFEDAVDAAAKALEELSRNRHTVGDASLSLTAPDAGRCTPSRFSPLPVAALLAFHLESLTSLNLAPSLHGANA